MQSTVAHWQGRETKGEGESDAILKSNPARKLDFAASFNIFWILNSCNLKMSCCYWYFGQHPIKSTSLHFFHSIPIIIANYSLFHFQTVCLHERHTNKWKWFSCLSLMRQKQGEKKDYFDYLNNQTALVKWKLRFLVHARVARQILSPPLYVFIDLFWRTVGRTPSPASVCGLKKLWRLRGKLWRGAVRSQRSGK